MSIVEARGQLVSGRARPPSVLMVALTLRRPPPLAAVSPQPLRGLAIDQKVSRAFLLASARAQGRPVQTLAILHALTESDARLDWQRIWLHTSEPNHVRRDAHPDPEPSDCVFEAVFEDVRISDTTARSLTLLAEILELYDLEMVETGVLALALIALPSSGAARCLLSGASIGHDELVDLVQSELLNCTLDELDDVLEGYCGDTIILDAQGNRTKKLKHGSATRESEWGPYELVVASALHYESLTASTRASLLLKLRALAIVEPARGLDHPDVATLLREVGHLLWRPTALGRGCLFFEWAASSLRNQRFSSEGGSLLSEALSALAMLSVDPRGAYNVVRDRIEPVHLTGVDDNLRRSCRRLKRICAASAALMHFGWVAILTAWLAYGYALTMRPHSSAAPLLQALGVVLAVFSVGWFVSFIVALAIRKRHAGLRELSSENIHLEMLRILDRLVKKSRSFDAVATRASVLAHMGEHSAAFEDLDYLVEAYPDDPQMRCARAHQYLCVEDHAQAIADLDAAIAMNAASTDALRLRADCKLALGDTLKASTNYSAALERNSADARSWAGRARCMLALDKPADGISDLDRALALSPAEQFWDLRGEARRRLGLLEEAQRDFTQAISLDPANAYAWARRGAVKRAVGLRASEALSDLDMAIAKASNLGDVRRHELGLKDVGRFSLDEVGKSIDAAISPTLFVAFSARSEVYTALGRVHDAT